jgi:galactose mutarotase-like enzyme
MIFSLTNDSINILISSLGAELRSLKTNSNDLEYIWQADPLFWPRHAPLLFPIVGKLKNNSYIYNNKEYSLPQHGFARDKEFEVTDLAEDKIIFKLNADKESVNNYPFDFELLISYQLVQQKVIISYEVFNPASEPLLFSIGTHPGFRCPLIPNERFDDYYLLFEHKETLIKHKIREGLLSGESEFALQNKNRLLLQKQMFQDDALVFKSFKSSYVILKNRQNPHQIKIIMEDFPYLGIWTKPSEEAYFLCIEPWLGIADSVHSDGKLEKKEGIITLQGGKKFNCSYNIEVS